MSFSTFGKLQNISKDYNHIISDLKSYSTIPSLKSAEQNRKSLYDKESGTLRLEMPTTPFWIWDKHKHQYEYNITDGKCCFNHIIGLPLNNKTGKYNPLFPYQNELIRALFDPLYLNPTNDPKKYGHVLVKKATGMAFTETSIRFMLWLPIRFPKFFRHSQMAIVTGINMPTAKRIMKRMKYLLYQKLRITTDTNDKVLLINDCQIEAFPANHPDTYRSLPNPKVIFADELAFFPPTLNDDVIDAIERYGPKSNPFIIAGSTANKPGDLLETLEQKSDEKSMYKKLYWLVDKGIGFIYTPEEIEIAKQSDSFAREYLGEHRGLKGNLFPQYLLDYAASLTNLLEVLDKQSGIVKRQIYRNQGELSISDVISDYRYLGPQYPTSIGIDVGYSASNFAYVVLKEIGGIIYVVKEIELQGATHEESVEVSKQLMFQDYPAYRPKLYVDASGVSFIRTLKKEIGELTDYHHLTQDDLVKSMLAAAGGMIVCPIAFNKFGDRMNWHAKRLFELGFIRISPEVTPKLWTALQSAQYNEEKQKFDKQNTSFNDVYDAFRLACINLVIGKLGVLYTTK